MGPEELLVLSAWVQPAVSASAATAAIMLGGAGSSGRDADPPVAQAFRPVPGLSSGYPTVDLEIRLELR